VRNSRAQYEQRLIDEYSENPKLFHSYIRKKKKGKLSVGPLKYRDGRVVCESGEMANLLVEAFAEVFVTDDPVSPVPSQVYEGRMGDVLVSVSKVKEVLMKLDVNSAIGPDEIHPMLLKSCAEQISVPLSLIFNMSLRSGVLPDCWKSSLVVPLFKAKSRCDPLNYRPVSLTSVCCKSLERILSDELVSFLEGNSLLAEEQFGFRKGRSVEDQLLLIYSEVSALVDEGCVVDMVLLDFSKAFDVVSHTLLLEKLRDIGLSSILLSWVWGFLSGRSMVVSVDGQVSESRDVLSGVPQGSVLGPILFLVYVNSLSVGISSKCGAFADDYKIYLHYQRENMFDGTGMSVLQDDLNRVTNAARSWNLSLNLSKCVVIRFTRRFIGSDLALAQSQYYIDNHVLEFVNSYRDLGVTVDCNLKFHCHVMI